MTFTKLPWRIGLPFATFVIAGSVALVAWTWWSIESEERVAFEKLAQTNAQFIRHMRLPPSERMARQLGEVLGVRVAFRGKDGFVPPLNELHSPVAEREFTRLPADGRFHLTGDWESVAVPLEGGIELVMTKPLVILPRALRHPRTLVVLGAFWLAAVILAWWLTRRLVRPLQHLAARLPEIEKPGTLELPEADRADEIGDVARAFVRTRAALRDERIQRERAEKLAVLGRMTAALAHEIQNPVSAIKMHAQLLAAGNEAAEVIAGEAKRIEGLVSQWMFLSRPEPPAMSPVALAEVLAAVLSAHRLRMEHARVKPTTLVEDDLIVHGDPRRLAQVFANLVMNAVQAMPRGGDLKIEACRADDGMAEVSISDSGPGFSIAALARLGEFFFSEKEGGMGIGLSVANEIVKAHGGELLASNKAEGGACVTVRFAVCVL